MNSEDRAKRQKRVARMKKTIIITTMILLIIPIVLCVILFIKVSQMQKQIDILVKLHNDEYVEMGGIIPEDSSVVVYAAERNNVETTSVHKDVDDEQQTEDEGSQNTERGNLNNRQELEEEKLKKEETQEEILDSKVSEKVYTDDLIEGKKAYLTFDDGPSKHTPELLEILRKNNVKATFFVIGKTDDYSKTMYKKIVEEGHTLAMHSYSHKYDKIYESKEAFLNDFYKIQDLLTEVTGIVPTIYRFPGGSSNNVSKLGMQEFIACLNQENITYFDWNAANGDAMGGKLSEEELLKNTLESTSLYESSIILMHDTDNKEKTISTLDKIIKELKKKKFTLLPITENTKPVQHIKADSVK